MSLIRRCLLAAFCLFTVAAARAQDALTPYFGPGTWIISTDDARAMKDILGLTPDQVSLVRDLARAAKSELGVVERKHQRSALLIEQAMWTDSPAAEEARKTYADIQARHAAEAEKVERQYLGDVRALLDDTQAALWPKFERARRRMLLAWFEEVTATNTDLTRIVRAFTLTPEEREGIAETLEKYEHEVDTLILEHRAVTREHPPWSARSWGHHGEPDPKQVEAQARLHAIAERLGAVQRSYAQMLAGRLPGERGEEILRAVEPSRGWFGPMAQDGRLRELMRVRGVTDEQKAAMRASFSRAEREFRREAGAFFDLLARQEKGEEVNDAAFQEASTKAHDAFAKARAKALKGAMDALTPEQRRGYEDGTDEARGGDDEDWRGEGWWW